MSLPLAQAIIIPDGPFTANSRVGGEEGIAIDPSELITQEEAERIRDEIGASEVRPWKPENPGHRVVYSDNRQLFQIMPGEQDAGLLRNAQFAGRNGERDGHIWEGGHWEGGPDAARWVTGNPVAAAPGPDAGSPEAPNVDPFAAARGLHSTEDCYKLLKKIADKLGVV